MNYVQNCVHVKCETLKIAQDNVDLHKGKYEITINKTKVKVKLVMEDGEVEVKIHDFSENNRNDDNTAKSFNPPRTDVGKHLNIQKFE